MTHTGKIARLPHILREQLNHRLRDAEPAEPLLNWLNALPEVQAVLQQQFDGHPINPQNLSEWRTGAYAEWSLRQEIFGALQSADETAIAVDELTNHRLAGQLLTLLTARYARFMNRWDGEVTPAINQQLKALSRLTRDLTTLQKAAGSDPIKPNQGLPGVGTARPHINSNSVVPATPCPSPAVPIPPTLAFSPQPLDLSTDPIKPNQGLPPNSPPDLGLETLDLRPVELLDDPGVRRRLLEKYGVAPAAPSDLSLEALDILPASAVPIILNQIKSTLDSLNWNPNHPAKTT